MPLTFNKSLMSKAALTLFAALTVSASQAHAGGFAIREQSASGLGAAFAGVGAGYDLSSVFWNSAAATVKEGFNSESHYSLIIPDAELTALPGSTFSPAGGSKSGSIADLAALGASYYSYQLNQKLFVAMGINSPFGLTTEPENNTWAGAPNARTASILTVNANPVLAYKLSDSLSVGVGAQIQYMEAKLKFATGTPTGPNTRFKGDDIGFGVTAGILFTPNSGTSIGFGYRSSVRSSVEGTFATNGTPLTVAAKAKIETPDILTLSIRQKLTDRMRLLGTFEWSRWSTFDNLTLTAKKAGTSVLAGPGPVAAGDTLAVIETNWDDSWFLSGGLEFDANRKLTLRTGVAYEKSPVQNPTQRLASVPDSDRIWLSFGATYKYSEKITFDIAYTHIFFEDVTLDQTSLSGATLLADVDQSTDIISASFKYKWGASRESSYK